MSLALGLAAGLFYDFLRVLRHRINSAAATMLMDALFWLIFGSALFLVGFVFGAGEHRLYMSLLAVLGGTVYFLLLSPAGLWVCGKILSCICFLLGCILKPLGFVYSFLKKVWKLIKKIFSFGKKCCKIRYTNQSVCSRKKNSIRASSGRGGNDVEIKAFRYSYENNSDNTGGIRGNNAASASRPHR